MANHVRPIVLSDEERSDLERLRRAAGVPAGLHRRARAVLLMADEVPGVEIARRTGYTPVQISRIRRRFADERLAGLEDRPRSGRPREVSARTIARVVALTLKPPPRGLTHWSARELADRTGLSHSTVHRIWQEHGLKPHRVETFKFSTDPQAEERIRDVVGLYLHPPENAAVLSLDEKTQIQALNRTQPLLPLRPGLPARQIHDYKRNGLTSLYAALDVERGKVIGECLRAPRQHRQRIRILSKNTRLDTCGLPPPGQVVIAAAILLAAFADLVVERYVLAIHLGRIPTEIRGAG